MDDPELNPYEPPELEAPTTAAAPAPPKPRRSDQLPHPHLGWAILWTLGLMITQIVLGIVLMIPLVMYGVSQGVGMNDMESFLERFQSFMLIAGTFITLSCSILIPLILFRKQMLARMGVRRFTWIQGIAVVLFTVPHSVIAGEVGNWAAKFLPTTGLEAFSDFSQEFWLLVFIGGCIFPAVGEEIFFRGFLSRGLVAHHGVVLGSIFASLLFALMHVLPVQVCVTFVAGLSIQAIFLLTRSLNAAILLHLLNNALAFAMMKYGDLIPIEGVTVEGEQAITHTPWLVLLTSVLACTALFGLLIQTRTIWRMPKGDEWDPSFTPTELPPPDFGAVAENAPPHLGWLAAVVLTYAMFMGSIAWQAIR